MKFTSETLRCIVTGDTPVDLHHVKARGMGGNHSKHLDEEWNLMPLRHDKHVEIEQIGIVRFAEKFPAARQWLVKNGWRFCPVLHTWRHAK
jgi:hypothetical protein